MTTLVGSIDEAVMPGESALIVAQENVTELLQDAVRREVMGRAAAIFGKRHFSEVSMLDSMERIFQAVCAQ